MKLSERSIKRLQEIITGDKGLSPYRSGPKLVEFFNEKGTNAVYGDGFPSRWMFAEGCIRQFNDTPALRDIVISAIDPRDYMDQTVWDQEKGEHRPVIVDEAVQYLNGFFEYDGYEIVPHGKGYNVRDINAGEILFDHKLDTEKLAHAFISEQVDKCKTKISQRDYDGAITNARSFIEAVLIEIDTQYDPNVLSYDGNLQKLYKRVQKHLNLSPDAQGIDDNLKQVLRGFINVINGLSGVSNAMGDRHARKHKPSKHHANLIVNSAMTFCNFILDSHAYQQNSNNDAA